MPDKKKRSHSHGHIRRSTNVDKSHQTMRSSSSSKVLGLGTSGHMKTIEFPAYGPARVIIRLERLMGSDRIRIMDPKYMATLLERLGEEEMLAWQKKTFERRKAEHNRFRQQAIDGYMEPGPDMQDVYNHPVFRVNRMLKRLQQLETSLDPHFSYPPITPLEPFSQDENGRIFKSYPTHVALRDRAMTENMEHEEEEEMSQHESIEGEYEVNKVYSRQSSTHEMFDASEREEEEEEEEEDDEEIESRTNSAVSMKPLPSVKDIGETEEDGKDGNARKKLSLYEIQKKYGIATDTDLGVQCKPYRSPLLDKLFLDEDTGVWELYEMGSKVTELIDQEMQVVNDYLAPFKKGSANMKVRSRKSNLKSSSSRSRGRGHISFQQNSRKLRGKSSHASKSRSALQKSLL